MANVKTSELADAGALAGTEQIPVNDGGTTRRTSVDDVVVRAAATLVASDDIRTIVVLATQAEYDALAPPDAETLYVVLEEA